MEQRMPLARYFFFVGGVLLALLLVLDACLPKIPLADRANANLPTIRIHSDRKWPERVVYDMSLPTIVPAQIVNREVNVAAQTTVADVAIKAKEREAFAQIKQSDGKQQVQPSGPKKQKPKLQRQSRIANKHTVPRWFLAARQSQFGWFANGIW
jgi:hypothetical protein